MKTRQSASSRLLRTLKLSSLAQTIDLSHPDAGLAVKALTQPCSVVLEHISKNMSCGIEPWLEEAERRLSEIGDSVQSIKSASGEGRGLEEFMSELSVDEQLDTGFVLQIVEGILDEIEAGSPPKPKKGCQELRCKENTSGVENRENRTKFREVMSFRKAKKAPQNPTLVDKPVTQHCVSETILRGHQGTRVKLAGKSSSGQPLLGVKAPEGKVRSKLQQTKKNTGGSKSAKKYGGKGLGELHVGDEDSQRVSQKFMTEGDILCGSGDSRQGTSLSPSSVTLPVITPDQLATVLSGLLKESGEGDSKCSTSVTQYNSEIFSWKDGEIAGRSICPGNELKQGPQTAIREIPSSFDVDKQGPQPKTEGHPSSSQNQKSTSTAVVSENDLPYKIHESIVPAVDGNSQTSENSVLQDKLDVETVKTGGSESLRKWRKEDAKDHKAKKKSKMKREEVVLVEDKERKEKGICEIFEKKQNDDDEEKTGESLKKPQVENEKEAKTVREKFVEKVAFKDVKRSNQKRKCDENHSEIGEEKMYERLQKKLAKTGEKEMIVKEKDKRRKRKGFEKQQIENGDENFSESVKAQQVKMGSEKNKECATNRRVGESKPIQRSKEEKRGEACEISENQNMEKQDEETMCELKVEKVDSVSSVKKRRRSASESFEKLPTEQRRKKIRMNLQEGKAEVAKSVFVGSIQKSKETKSKSYSETMEKRSKKVEIGDNLKSKIPDSKESTTVSASYSPENVSRKTGRGRSVSLSVTGMDQGSDRVEKTPRVFRDNKPADLKKTWESAYKIPKKSGKDSDGMTSSDGRSKEGDDWSLAITSPLLVVNPPVDMDDVPSPPTDISQLLKDVEENPDKIKEAPSAPSSKRLSLSQYKERMARDRPPIRCLERSADPAQSAVPRSSQQLEHMPEIHIALDPNWYSTTPPPRLHRFDRVVPGVGNLPGWHVPRPSLSPPSHGQQGGVYDSQPRLQAGCYPWVAGAPPQINSDLLNSIDKNLIASVLEACRNPPPAPVTLNYQAESPWRIPAGRPSSTEMDTGTEYGGKMDLSPFTRPESATGVDEMNVGSSSNLNQCEIQTRVEAVTHDIDLSYPLCESSTVKEVEDCRYPSDQQYMLSDILSLDGNPCDKLSYIFPEPADQPPLPHGISVTTSEVRMDNIRPETELVRAVNLFANPEGPPLEFSVAKKSSPSPSLIPESMPISMGSTSGSGAAEVPDSVSDDETAVIISSVSGIDVDLGGCCISDDELDFRSVVGGHPERLEPKEAPNALELLRRTYSCPEDSDDTVLSNLEADSCPKNLDPPGYAAQSLAEQADLLERLQLDGVDGRDFVMPWRDEVRNSEGLIITSISGFGRHVRRTVEIQKTVRSETERSVIVSSQESGEVSLSPRTSRPQIRKNECSQQGEKLKRAEDVESSCTNASIMASVGSLSEKRIRRNSIVFISSEESGELYSPPNIERTSKSRDSRRSESRDEYRRRKRRERRRRRRSLFEAKKKKRKEFENRSWKVQENWSSLLESVSSVEQSIAGSSRSLPRAGPKNARRNRASDRSDEGELSSSSLSSNCSSRRAYGLRKHREESGSKRKHSELYSRAASTAFIEGKSNRGRVTTHSEKDSQKSSRKRRRSTSTSSTVSHDDRKRARNDWSTSADDCHRADDGETRKLSNDIDKSSMDVELSVDSTLSLSYNDRGTLPEVEQSFKDKSSTAACAKRTSGSSSSSKELEQPQLPRGTYATAPVTALSENEEDLPSVERPILSKDPLVPSGPTNESAQTEGATPPLSPEPLSRHGSFAELVTLPTKVLCLELFVHRLADFQEKEVEYNSEDDLVRRYRRRFFVEDLRRYYHSLPKEDFDVRNPFDLFMERFGELYRQHCEGKG